MHRHPRRRGIAAALTVAALAAAVPGTAYGITPVDGGPLDHFFPVAINTSTGDQYDPHVSGDLASYTSQIFDGFRYYDSIRYYDFLTGNDLQVPAPPDAVDYLSDVSNGRIVYSRIEASGRSPIMVFDTVSSLVTEVDPQLGPLVLRTQGAIGSDTVAFVDLSLTPTGEIVASQLGGSTLQVTNDARTDRHPSVAPSGDLIVYESCQATASNCDVRQAGWNGTSWVITNITDSTDPEANPGTDGTVVVYDSTRAGERDIYWQPVGGGTEQVLTLTGMQRNPSVNAGIVAFESDDDEFTADLYVYEIASNRVFRITDTPFNENLNDVSVLPDGRVRVVWSSGSTGARDVYGATFKLPTVEPPAYDFGGFLQPVDPRPTLNSVKAGAAVPVKFSLGGDHGPGIFETGYPKSEVIACDATADVDGIEQTVSAGGSSLSFDPLTGVYSYTWKTDKAWAGTCRQLVLKFADGTSQRANFKLK
jgi:hypothetical protein